MDIIKRMYKTWSNYHTSFIKLPVVAIFIVAATLFLSGCSTQLVEDGWDVIKNPETYNVMLRPNGSIAYLIKTTEN